MNEYRHASAAVALIHALRHELEQIPVHRHPALPAAETLVDVGRYHLEALLRVIGPLDQYARRDRIREQHTAAGIPAELLAGPTTSEAFEQWQAPQRANLEANRARWDAIGRLEWRIIPAGELHPATLFCNRPGLASVALQINAETLAGPGGGWAYLEHLVDAITRALT